MFARSGPFIPSYGGYGLTSTHGRGMMRAVGLDSGLEVTGGHLGYTLSSPLSSILGGSPFHTRICLAGRASVVVVDVFTDKERGPRKQELFGPAPGRHSRRGSGATSRGFPNMSSKARIFNTKFAQRCILSCTAVGRVQEACVFSTRDPGAGTSYSKLVFQSPRQCRKLFRQSWPATPDTCGIDGQVLRVFRALRGVTPGRGTVLCAW